MKTQPFEKKLSTSQGDKLEDLLNDWVLATKQFSYWHHELTEAIQNNDLANQALLTATFYSNSRWTKTELIALQHDLYDRLSSLLTKHVANQPDQPALALGNQLRDDTRRIKAWCQQIRAALGLDSVERA